MSWRDFYQLHPACEEWPELLPDQRKALKADIEANYVKVPIQTRQVAGDGATYVIDGRTRLDLMEELGRQVVNAEGEWIGALVGKVEHKAGRTHREICLEVLSYNAHRRHVLSKQQLAESVVATLRVGREIEGKHEGKNDSANLARSFSPTPGKRGGSTKNELKAEAVEQAAQAGISERTVERVLSKGTPKKKPHKGREIPFSERVLKDFQRLMDKYEVEEHRKVKAILRKFLSA